MLREHRGNTGRDNTMLREHRGNTRLKEHIENTVLRGHRQREHYAEGTQAERTLC